MPSSNLPPTIEYTKQSYWNSRFESETQYDWLCTWNDLQHLVDPLVQLCLPNNADNTDFKSAKILLVGVGTSSLPRDMTDSGYNNLTATDYSEVVIKKCLATDDSNGKITYEVRDMLDLQYPDNSFDVVFDKAAMDAVLAVGGDKWTPDPALMEKTDRILNESWRVLRDGGVYIQVSFSQPHFRGLFLKSEKQEGKWRDFKKQDVEKGLGYFCYSMVAKKDDRRS